MTERERGMTERGMGERERDEGQRGMGERGMRDREAWEGERAMQRAWVCERASLTVSLGVHRSIKVGFASRILHERAQNQLGLCAKLTELAKAT